VKEAKLNAKFRAFRTDEYKIKTLKITATLFFGVYFGDLRGLQKGWF